MIHYAVIIKKQLTSSSAAKVNCVDAPPRSSVPYEAAVLELFKVSNYQFKGKYYSLRY